MAQLSRGNVVRVLGDGRRIWAIPLNAGLRDDEAVLLDRFRWDLFNSVGISSEDFEFLSLQLSPTGSGFQLFLREIL